MHTETIYGDYKITGNKDNEFNIKLKFDINDIKSDWKRCNLISNYIAEYSCYNFELEDKAENLISTVMNELIEKFSCIASADSKLLIDFTVFSDTIQFDIETAVDKTKENLYKETLEKITKNSDSEKLYFDIIDKLEKENSDFEFGLVMLVNDYNGKISSVFNNENNLVKVRIIIKKEEILK